MARHRSTPERRRLGHRAVAAALGVIALAAGAGAAIHGRGADSSLPSEPVGAAPERASASGQGELQAAGPPAGAERLSASALRRATELTVRELRAAVAAARRGEGSPVAAVAARTALRAAPGGEVVEHIGTETEFGSPRVLAVVGQRGPWLEVMAAELENGQTGWVVADRVEVGRTGFSLHADLSERVVEVRRGGRVVRRLQVAVGGPATPTPSGTYAVTDKIEVTDEGSPYGCCAVALTGHQPNVPQEWSGGDRLAIHATPHETTIGHAATLGCLRAGDAHMRWLVDNVPLGTPVTVGR